MQPLAKPALTTPSPARRRIGLALWLVACWILLAASREYLFYSYRWGIDNRWSDLLFANQLGLVHAQIFAITVATFATQPRFSIWSTFVGVAAIVMTIVIARVGYVYNLYDPTQSMIVRALAYALLLFAVSRRVQQADHQGDAPGLRLSIVDAFLLTLIVAVFLGVLQDRFFRYPKVWKDDLLSAHGNIASFALFSFESLIEAGLGLLWLRLMTHRRFIAIGLPLLVAAIFLSSIVSTLVAKAYGAYQFGYPLNLQTFQDSFQLALPMLLTFTLWFSILSYALRGLGALDLSRFQRPIEPT